MRSLVRFILRLLLVPSEEWAKAKIDAHAATGRHAINALLATELTSFHSALAGVDQLNRDAARFVLKYPFAQELIADLLKERLDRLVTGVNQAASTDWKAA